MSDENKIQGAENKREICSVHDFVMRHGLGEAEEHRLLLLFGPNATEQELATNVEMPSRIR